jgi:hypothetical protein
MRRFTPILLAAALVSAAGAATAQDFVFGWNPRTGDVWVDNTLGDMNQYGYRYRESFVDELVRYYDAPRDYVTELLVQQRWAPGDVYYACAIGEVIGRSCRYVADEWEQDHVQGWGVLAQRLGIKPCSGEFHRLKQGFVPTYDHWARPIELDDRLRAAYPDRGNERLVEKIRRDLRDDDGPGNNGKARGNDGAPGNSGKAKGDQGHGNSGKAKGNQGHGNNGKAKGNQGHGNNGKAKGHGKD